MSILLCRIGIRIGVLKVLGGVMEVILQEDFPSLGYVGDRVVVRRGYARNYLIPRGIALELASGGAKAVRHLVEIVEAKRRKKRKEAEERLKDFLGLTLEFQLKGNEHGKVFGSVTSKDIEVAFLSKKLVVDRRQIRLLDPIRGAGTHEVTIKLHADVSATIKVAVAVEVPKKVEPPTEERGARRGRRRNDPTSEENTDGVEEA